MVSRSVQPLPRPLRALAAALALALLGVLPAAARADCPGGGATCPYVTATQIGQRAEGVMRFPQALAIGPDGSVYVADQGSHVVQVFGPDGVFRREFGIAGPSRASSAASALSPWPATARCWWPTARTASIASTPTGSS